MDSGPVIIPGRTRPITIDKNPARVTILVAGRVIADTRNALTVRETLFPEVQYIPRVDVDMSALTHTDLTTYSPSKGDACHFSILVGGTRRINAAWSYEVPYESMASICGYLAFYPDRVDEIRISQGT